MVYCIMYMKAPSEFGMAGFYAEKSFNQLELQQRRMAKGPH